MQEGKGEGKVVSVELWKEGEGTEVKIRRKEGREG
jgi:hypothetical protein